MSTVQGFTERAISVGRLADIRQFAYKPGERESEFLLQVGKGDSGVLPSIVQPGGCDDLPVIGNRGDKVSNRLQMDRIRFEGIFPPVVEIRMGLGGIPAGHADKIIHDGILRPSGAKTS